LFVFGGGGGRSRANQSVGKAKSKNFPNLVFRNKKNEIKKLRGGSAFWKGKAVDGGGSIPTVH